MTREPIINTAIAALLLAVPFAALAIGELFYITLATRMAILALAAVGLNLALGLGGLVSFGHAAFFGIGGYAAGILSTHALNMTPLFTWPFEIGGSEQMPVVWLVAVVVSGLVALAIGAVSLRTSGVYFIMITLAFAQMVYYFAISWPAYGGEDGLSIAMRGAFPGVNTAVPLNFFLICYGVLAGGAFPVRLHPRFAFRRGIAGGAAERDASRRGRHRPVSCKARSLRHLGDDNRARRRALRRPQPLCQPVDAVMADVGRTDRAYHPRRHRTAVRSGRRRHAVRADRIAAGRTD